MNIQKVAPAKASAAAVAPPQEAFNYRKLGGRLTHFTTVVGLLYATLSPMLAYTGKWEMLVNTLAKVLLSYCVVSLPVFCTMFYDYESTPWGYAWAIISSFAYKIYLRLRWDYSGTVVVGLAMCIFDWKIQTMSPMLPWAICMFLVDGLHRVYMICHYLKNIDLLRDYYKKTSWGYLCSDDPSDWSLAINLMLGYSMGWCTAFTAHLVIFTVPTVKFTNCYVDWCVGMSVGGVLVLATMKFQNQYERIGIMQGCKPKPYKTRFGNAIFECMFSELSDHNTFFLSHKGLHKNSDKYHLTHYDHHNLIPTYLIQDSGMIEGLKHRLCFQLTVPLSETTHGVGILCYMIHGCLRHHYCPLVYPKFMANFNHRTQFHHLLHHFAPEGNPFHFVGLFDTFDKDKDFKKLWREERILKKIRQTGEPGGGSNTFLTSKAE